MDSTTGDVEKEFAVVKFHADETYSTCSLQHKTADSAGFFVGKEVTIRWSKHEIFKGIVIFTDGENCKYFFHLCLYY